MRARPDSFAFLACLIPLVLVGCGPSSPASQSQATSQAAVATPAELEPSGQRSELCSAANVVGVGLRGEYFAAPRWQGAPVLTRVDASIDFIDGFDLPAEAAAQAPQSVRWSGWVKAPTNGRYRFHVAPPTARVTVARVDMQAGGSAQGAAPGAAQSAGLDMVAGRFYPITVELDGPGPRGMPVRLEWTAPHGARYIVPRAVLNLPTETVAAPPAGG